MKVKSTIRKLGQVMVGYFAVGIFVGSFFAIYSHAEYWFGLSVPLSEATVLTIAAVVATPLVLPFVWKLISKIKYGDLEINLVHMSETVEVKLAIELASFEIKSKPTELEKIPKLEMEQVIFEPKDLLGISIKEAETTGVIEVNLGTGSSWFSTRLFLLAALVEDYTDIRQIIFLENRKTKDRVFLGSSSPTSVRGNLSSYNPRLEEAYEFAKREAASMQGNNTVEISFAWIAQNYLFNLDGQNGEDNQKEWVTSQLLIQRLHITKNCIEWNGGPSTKLLLFQILEHIEPHVFLVAGTGQLNLVIDRLKLMERIASDYLRQRLE